MKSMHAAAILMTIAVLLGSAVASAEPPAARNFVAHLEGEEEVPSRDTRAVGQAILQVDTAETALVYRLIATNIDNVVTSHIHLGVFGVNGPVVAFLAGAIRSRRWPSQRRPG